MGQGKTPKARRRPKPARSETRRRGEISKDVSDGALLDVIVTNFDDVYQQLNDHMRQIRRLRQQLEAMVVGPDKAR